MRVMAGEPAKHANLKRGGRRKLTEHWATRNDLMMLAARCTGTPRPSAVTVEPPPRFERRYGKLSRDIPWIAARCHRDQVADPYVARPAFLGRLDVLPYWRCGASADACERRFYVRVSAGGCASEQAICMRDRAKKSLIREVIDA
jgi:hypothetical protein